MLHATDGATLPPADSQIQNIKSLRPDKGRRLCSVVPPFFIRPGSNRQKPKADLFTLYAGYVSSLEDNIPRSPERLQGEFIRPYTGSHHPPALCAEENLSFK